MADVTEQQQHAIEPEELAAWIKEWSAKSLSHSDFRDTGNVNALPFQQCWWDSEAGEVIDFAAIIDPDELIAQSEKAERQYLEELDRRRRSYVLSAPEYQQKTKLKEFERALCRNDLYYLVKYVLGYDQLVFHLHYFMCGSVENQPEGYRCLREFPRDAFKTTCMGIGKSIQEILKDPNIHILYKSNSQPNAAAKVTEAKRHFVNNDHLKQLFPEHVPKRKSEEGSGSAWTTPASTSVQAEATLSAAGVGTSKVSQHYDMIIGDDFWDKTSVKNPEVMTTVRDEMGQLEYLLASPAKGRIQYIGTRFAHDDPSTDLDKDPTCHCTFLSGVTPSGRSIFPGHLSLEKMYSQSKSNLYVFSCQIMLNPTDDAQGFNRSWFQYLEWEEMKRQRDRGEIGVRIRILTDATADGKSTSDNIAIIVLAVDSKERMLVADYIREKADPAQFVDNLFNLYDRWLPHSPDYIARQKTAIETTIMSFVNRRQQKRIKEGKRSLPFYDYSLAKREKKMRITSALQPPFQAGQIYFDPNLEALPELERQLLQHPNTTEDDGPDALSMIDDPVLSGAPSFKPPSGPVDDTYIPKIEAADDIEQEWRRQQAQQVFANARQSGKRPKRTAPGSVIR